MKTKPSRRAGAKRSGRRSKAQSQKAELVLHLDRHTFNRLAACCAFDNTTPERFAEQALGTCIDAAMAAMESAKPRRD